MKIGKSCDRAGEGMEEQRRTHEDTAVMGRIGQGRVGKGRAG